MDQEKQAELNQGTVLKELSDIKASLAVNTNETANIKDSVAEIKTAIREIKNDFVNRREFNNGLVALREEFSPLKRLVYGLAGIILLTVVAPIVQMVLIK